MNNFIDTGEEKNSSFDEKRRRRNNGKLEMPNETEIEAKVIGCLITMDDSYDIFQHLLPQHFYNVFFRLSYETLLNMFATATEINMFSVREHLEKSPKLSEIYPKPELFNAAYLSVLQQSKDIPYASRHKATWIAILKDRYTRRSALELSLSMARAANDMATDAVELISDTGAKINDLIHETAETGSNPSMQTIVIETIAAIEKATSADTSGAAGTNMSRFSGIESGITELDNITLGFQNSDLIIVAARPSMGKTAFALKIASHAAINQKKHVLFISLEMSRQQLVTRLFSMDTKICATNMRTRNGLSPQDWILLTSSADVISNAPLTIRDASNNTPSQIAAMARALKAKDELDLIIIDYLQLMTSADAKKRTFNREQEISSISRNLKQLAKSLNIPIIALSQLSRAVETRSGDKRPQLADLRESGAIEQDADLVLFLYRPEYYGFDIGEDGMPTTGKAEIIVAKQRNGQLGTATAKFESRYTSFENFDNPAANYNNLQQQPAIVPPPAKNKNKKASDFFDEEEAPF